mmetsp:Transcript_16577/g.23053  ORF Transcript_16577/g.23053 Transcript_16577/m.23053 type:complete len:252 (-) Transcript_16577:150-905(-)
MKLRRACNGLLLCLATADAFAPFLNTRARSSITLMAEVEGGKGKDPLRRVFSGFGVAAAVLTFSAAANASPMNHDQDQFYAVYSSSMPVAETIKTMDMSMPSSYGAISDVKNSATDELTQVENLATGTKTKVKKKANTSKAEPAAKLSAEERAALATQKKAEKEATAAEKAAEKEATAAAKAAERNASAEEKAAARAAEKAEKAAAKAAAKELAAQNAEKKEAMESEKKYSGVTFVDMGLPSYEPAASGKK